jgi:spore coat polysaccharide biosynthesis predicted glycosyltransferase SpsG
VFKNAEFALSPISVGKVVYDYKVFDIDCVMELTFDNVILDRCFRINSERRVNKSIDTIFLNQGGSDPWGLSPRILYALDLLHIRTPIVVVIGEATHQLTYKQILSCNKTTDLNLDIVYNAPTVIVVECMLSSDLAITAPGQTFAELSSLCVPSIVIGHHSRHAKISKEIASAKAGIDLGVGVTMKDFDLVSNLAVALKAMRGHEQREMYATNAKAMINVHGVDQITKIIKGYL